MWSWPWVLSGLGLFDHAYQIPAAEKTPRHRVLKRPIIHLFREPSTSDFRWRRGNLGMIALTQFMNRVDEGVNMVWVDTGMYAVSQVEHMPFAVSKAFQYRGDFFANSLR